MKRTAIVAVSLFLPVSLCGAPPEADRAKMAQKTEAYFKLRAEQIEGRLKNAPLEASAESLKAADWAERLAALNVLGRRGAKAVPLLLAYIDQEQRQAKPDVRLLTAAAWSLGEIGPAAGKAAGVMIEWLTHPDDKLRIAAAAGLGGVKAAGAKPAFALAGALRDQQPLVRAYAAESLGKMGAGARDARGALIEAVQDPALYSDAAAWALGGVGGGAVSAAQTLQKVLREKALLLKPGGGCALKGLDEFPQEMARAVSRAYLADALRRIGPPGKEARQWYLRLDPRPLIDPSLNFAKIAGDLAHAVQSDWQAALSAELKAAAQEDSAAGGYWHLPQRISAALQRASRGPLTAGRRSGNRAGLLFHLDRRSALSRGVGASFEDRFEVFLLREGGGGWQLDGEAEFAFPVWGGADQSIFGDEAARLLSCRLSL